MAAQKKSQKKALSPSTGGRLSDKEYKARFNDADRTLSQALKAVEHLELDLKRIKKKLNCFSFNPRIHVPWCPFNPPSGKKKT